MAIDAFNPPEMWKPFGAFSMGVVQGEGRVVHLKGQVSLDREGRIVGPGDMRAQVTQVLGNIKTMLAHVGGEMGDIYTLTHYVTDISEFMKTGDIRTSFFSAPFPVTTTVEVAALYDPNLVVEITASAEIPLDRFKHPSGS